MKYVLGVDGGNTKTQYYLYTTSGEYVDCLRTGTCSHEQFADGFVGCKKVLGRQLNEILDRNRVKPSNLVYSVFGLAGADFEWQKVELSRIISSLGFNNFIVENDGYIALKAGSANGVGICSINGTGTVTVGINQQGKRLQVGGIGDISGDRAGGNYLARRVMAAVYDNCFRCGADTKLKDVIFETFKIAGKDDYAEKSIEVLSSADNILKINHIIGDIEKQSDKVAIDILSKIGEDLGKSTSGCLRAIECKGAVNIVLAGSIWVKGGYKAMFDRYKEIVSQSCLSETTLRYTVLKQEPAIGSIIWALESAGSMNKKMREKLIG